MEKNISNKLKISILVFSNSIRKVSTLVISIFFARTLSKYDYGSYKQAFLLYQLLAPFFIWGIPYSINYFFPKIIELKKKKRFILQTGTLVLMLGILFCLFLIFTKGYFVVKFNNPKLNDLLKIISVYAAIEIASSFYTPFLVCVNKNILLAKIDLSSNLIKIPLLALMAIYKYSLVKILLVLCLISLVKYAYILLFTFNFFKVKLLDFKEIINNLEMAKEQLKFSFPIGLSSMVGTINNGIDKIVVSMFYSANVYATYANGAIQIPFLPIMIGSVSQIITPLLSKYYSENNIVNFFSIWHKSIENLCIILYPLFFYFFVFSEDLITLMFSNIYLASSTIFRIYCLLILVRITSYSTILISTGNTKYVFYNTVFQCFLNIILNLIFIRLFGYIGPPLATVITVFIAVAIMLLIISKKLKCNLKKLLPWRKIIKIFVISGVSISPFILLKYFLNIHFFGDFIYYMFLFFILYNLLIYKMLKTSLINIIIDELRIIRKNNSY